MAVNGNLNFQRRNQGLLAETPNFSDVGQSAYVDYAAGDAEELLSRPSLMREAVEEADAAPAEPVAGERTAEAMAQYEAAQKAYLDRALVDAERKAKSAGNPINVLGSVLGGIVGAPFSLLENAVGGGNNDLTAPFTPKQNAQGPLAQARANIAAQQVILAQKMDGYQSGLVKAVTDATTNKGERIQGVQNQLAIAARNAAILKAQGKDPQMAFERSKNFLMANPVAASVMQELGYDEMPWYDGLAAELSQSKDAVTRLDDSSKVSNVVVPQFGTVVQTNQFGERIGTIQQDGSLTAPVVSPNPTTPTELPTFTLDDWNNAGGTSGNAGGTFR